MDKNYISVPANNRYDLQHFSVPQHYRDDLESIMLPHGLVVDRVRRVAHQIHTHYTTTNKNNKNIPLLAICILKGAHQFYNDLVQELKRINSLLVSNGLPIEMEFIRCKSYVNDESNKVQLLGIDNWTELETRFKGKNLIVVEDIIDTGRTMSVLLPRLKAMEHVVSVEVASLFIKRRSDHGLAFVPRFVGFSIPDEFIVGYGLDYNEKFRDLDHVCIINESGKLKYRT